jgi:outer membrane protein
VQVKIPLFDGFSRNYKARGAHAQVEVQKDILDEARQQVGLDVWKGYQALRTNIQNVGNTATLEQIAQRSFDVAKHRYAAGVGNILELLNAQKRFRRPNSNVSRHSPTGVRHGFNWPQ